MRLYILLFVLFLSSCGLGPDSENSYQFYYINDYNSTGQVLVPVTRYLPEPRSSISAKTLVEAHLSFGWEQDVKTPFPTGLTVLRAEEGLPGIVDVYFSEDYSDLSGMLETVANYAVVKTLSQLSWVVGVRIYIQGEDYSQEPPAVLREYDILVAELNPEG